MRIGFLRADVIQGGQYETLYYNNIIIPDRTPEKVGNYFAIDVEEDEISYTWLVNNMANVKWDGIGIFAELPVANKTTPTPAWLPNNTYLDEFSVEQTFTLEEYGMVREDSLDNLKWVFKATVYGDLDESQLTSLDGVITGIGGAIGLLTDQARTLLNGPAYITP
jgi:hypothetical protein